MKKAFKSRIFLLAILITLLISAFSFVAYTKTRSVYSEATECCSKAEPENSEMLWDVLSRQFVSAVHFQ
ncbi:MAG: hypothetical protein ACTHMD_00960 [Flavisolibacter sp.]